jgi:hypothetical protein
MGMTQVQETKRAKARGKNEVIGEGGVKSI